MKKLITMSTLVLTLSVHAQDMGQGGGKRKPPKEALEACQNNSAGDSCEFSGKNNKTLSGTCFRPNENIPLACKPSNMGQGPQNSN